MAQTVKAQIQATKQIKSNMSGVLPQKTFRFKLMQGGQLISTSTADANGNIIFPEIDYDTIGEHDYQIVEVVDNPPLPGWNYDYHSCSVHTSVTTDPNTGQLVIKVQYNPQISPNFVNTYTSNDANVSLKNKVISHGKDLTDGQFEIDLVDGNGNIIGRVHNDANGNIVFPNVTLPVGNYTLKIVPPKNADGWSYDKPSIPIQITVKDNGDGTSTPIVEYPEDPDFNVTYKPEPTKQKIVAHKVIDGWTLPEKSGKLFTFVLKDSSGNVIKRIQSTDGNLDFGDIDLTEVGEKDFTISEEGSDGNGWILDKNSYPVKVTATDDGNGHLVGSVDIVPTLRNTYKPSQASTGADGTPKAKKSVLGGKTLESGQFTFGVFDDKGNLITTGTNDENGNIKFPVGYFDKAGEYNYTIKETTPDGGGYTTDKNSYPYKVVVTDNGNGQLIANITQPTPEPIFVNKYTSAGSESILAFKSLQGWDNGKNAPNFNFSLKDDKGNVIKQLQSNGGTLDFGVLQFTEPGDYEYTVNEDTPLPDGWSIPTRSYRVIVHMEDDGKGDLIASVTYPDSNNTSPQFVNTYSTTPANVGGVISNNPSGENPTKTVSGGDKVLQDSQFRFGLFDKNGNLVALGFNRANGKINFPVFFVSNLGESDYTMKELTPDGNGWTTDKTNYPVKVNITDNGQGQRTATVTYPNGTPAFKNTYTAENSNVNITGKVNGDEKQPTDGEFEFDVVDKDGNIVGKAHNDGNGNIVFPPLNLPEGDHDFKIIPPPDGNGWTFNVPDLPVHIHVSDNGDGTTSPKITYPDGNIFNPDYNPTPANVGNIIANNPSGQNPKKIATDAPLSNHQFTFGLYDEYNKLVAVGYNTADGKIEFLNFLMTTLGNTQYTMKEATVDGNGWTTDRTSYPVNINITDDGSGVLKADVTYPGGTPIFRNTYNYTPISQQITANKTLHNWNGNDKSFNFFLKNENGDIIKTAQNIAQDIDGLIDFGEISYNDPGTYVYTIEEQSSPNEGWTTDTNIYSVVVTVIRDSSGKLVSSVEYPIGTPIFNNYYFSQNATVNIYGRKTAVGKNFYNGQFEFELDDSNGNKISTAKNEADGYIYFPEFDLPAGDYDFTMKEITPDGNGWTTDKKKIPVQVQVVDNGDGTTTAKISYTNGNEFVNVYKPKPVEVTVNAKKCVCGACLCENMFEFGLYDSDDVEISTAKNDAQGNISFPKLTFNSVGTYHYTIKELSKSGCGWQCDNRTFGVTITVTDTNGKLSAVLNYDGGKVPCFVNYYNSCC